MNRAVYSARTYSSAFGRGLAVVDDPLADLGRERRIVQDRLVGPKDRGLLGAYLAGDFLVQGTQIGRRPLAR